MRARQKAESSYVEGHTSRPTAKPLIGAGPAPPAKEQAGTGRVSGVKVAALLATSAASLVLAAVLASLLPVAYPETAARRAAVHKLLLILAMLSTAAHFFLLLAILAL